MRILIVDRVFAAILSAGAVFVGDGRVADMGQVRTILR